MTMNPDAQMFVPSRGNGNGNLRPSNLDPQAQAFNAPSTNQNPYPGGRGGAGYPANSPTVALGPSPHYPNVSSTQMPVPAFGKMPPPHSNGAMQPSYNNTSQPPRWDRGGRGGMQPPPNNYFTGQPQPPFNQPPNAYGQAPPPQSAPYGSQAYGGPPGPGQYGGGNANAPVPQPSYAHQGFSQPQPQYGGAPYPTQPQQPPYNGQPVQPNRHLGPRPGSQHVSVQQPQQPLPVRPPINTYTPPPGASSVSMPQLAPAPTVVPQPQAPFVTHRGKVSQVAVQPRANTSHPAREKPLGLQQPQDTKPIVVLVIGVHRSGKSSTANSLARKKNYDYVCGKQDEDEETPLYPLQALASALDKPGPRPRGIVLDDFIWRPGDLQYLNHFLTSRGLQLDSVVFMEGGLELAAARDSRHTAVTMLQHPVSFDVSMSYDGTNILLNVRNIEKRSLDDVAKELILEADAAEKERRSPFPLPVPSLCEGVPMVVDGSLFTRMRDAIMSALCLNNSNKLAFPAMQPGAFLDYAQFVRNYYELHRSFVTYKTSSTPLLIVKFEDNVYLIPQGFTTAYKVEDRDRMPRVFVSTQAPQSSTGSEPPESLNASDKRSDAVGVDESAADSSAVSSPASPAGTGQLAFVLEGELCMRREHMSSGSGMVPLIFICDYLWLNGQLGSSVPRMQRYENLRLWLGDLDPYSMFLQKPQWPIQELNAMPAAPLFGVEGYVFVPHIEYNYSSHSPRFFQWQPGEKASINVRLWAGREADIVENKQKVRGWVFSGYVLDEDNEVPLEGEVHVPGSRVAEYQLNDGHVISCAPVFAEKPAPPKGGRQPTPQAASSVAVSWFYRNYNPHVLYPSQKGMADFLLRNEHWSARDMAMTIAALPRAQILRSPTDPK